MALEDKRGQGGPPKQIFDTLLLKGVRQGQIPGRTLEARKWFRQAARDATRYRAARSGKFASQLMREGQSQMVTRMGIGSFYLFFYDSKLYRAGKLPYYDKFPLIIYIGPSAKYPNLVLGLNFHYLPLRLRAKLMDALYEVVSDNRFDDQTKMRINYGILKSVSKYKYFRPCIKAYDKSFFRSRFLKVHPTDWDMALMLPVADWQGARQATVWRDSREKILF